MTGLKTAFFIAYKSILKGRRSTLALMIFILSLSFLNLTFIAGTLDGLSRVTIDEVIETETAHIVINPRQEPRAEEYISGWRQLSSRIESIPGVQASSRHYRLVGSVGFDPDGSGRFQRVSTQMIAVEPAREREVLSIDERLVDGEYLDEPASDEVILGVDLVSGYGGSQEPNLGPVGIGDRVQLTFANGETRTLRVKGFYRLGFFSGLVFMSAKEAESVLGVEDSASQVLVRVDNEQDQLDHYYEQIQSIAPDLNVKKYTDLLGDEAAIGETFDTISAIMSVISVVVAAITVFILIYINAIHKQRQIGVLKAIGIKQGIIIESYIIQALFYALCGIAVGSILVFLVLDPLLTAYPIETPMGDSSLAFSAVKILVSIAGFVIAAMLAGLIPAWRVARQGILKAIWGS